MKTFIADIIPNLQKHSQKLDNITLLTNQHWVVVDEIVNSKTVYIFRTNNELLISKNGKVEKAKWEYLGKSALLIDLKDGSYLFRHGFFDENILALKIDGKEEYAFLVNESRFDRDLNSFARIQEFLQNMYFNPETISAISGSKNEDTPSMLSMDQSIPSNMKIDFTNFSENKRNSNHRSLMIIFLVGIGIVAIILFAIYKISNSENYLTQKSTTPYENSQTSTDYLPIKNIDNQGNGNEVIKEPSTNSLGSNIDFPKFELTDERPFFAEEFYLVHDGVVYYGDTYQAFLSKSKNISHQIKLVKDKNFRRSVMIYIKYFRPDGSLITIDENCRPQYSFRQLVNFSTDIDYKHVMLLKGIDLTSQSPLGIYKIEVWYLTSLIGFQNFEILD